jgi:hypothetical protein
MARQVTFITGKPANHTGLLSRFLPPIPEGIASNWIVDNLESGSWVLDPFGTSPDFTLDIARAGCKVLVSANNPIARFMLELGANPPKEEDFHSALAELAATRVGDERLEIHLQQLYQTNCAKCGQLISAQAFIWERESTIPQAKVYECNHCGDSGEHPVNQSDIEIAQSFTAASLHRMRVLERITPPGDPERDNVEEALSVYLPRAIYALTTLINRLDGLLVSPKLNETIESIRYKSLIALVLSALDKGNNLWSYPSGRPRPKQLSSSPRFREDNLWFILEEAVNQLARDQKSVPFSIYPQIPQDSGGVILFEGPLRDLCENLLNSDLGSEIDFGAIMSAIPRHNQAFWTLSALWAGWIWGHEAIGSFRSVLRRRRYDWAWHCTALSYAFNSLADILQHKVPFFAVIAEAESSFINATGIAVGRAGFSLNGIALRADSKLAQIHWEYDPDSQNYYQITAPALLEDHFRELIITEGIQKLRQRGEPAPFLSMNTAALIRIIMNQGLTRDLQTSSADEYSRIHQLIETTFSFQHGFIRYGGGEKTPDSASIWHQEIINPTAMLSDRVEVEVLQLMSERPQINHHQIDQSICEIFPGMMTPTSELINICIESYSSKKYLEKEKIILREQDDPKSRNLELLAIRMAIRDLGNQLGYSAQGDSPIIWGDAEEDVCLVFFISSSARIGEIVFNSSYPPDKSIIVLPGARANLIVYKLRNNLYLNQIIESGWRFLKFRHLRHLLESPSLKRENIDTLLALDPLTESPAQMRLL